MNPTQKQFSLTGVSLNKANAYQLLSLITLPWLIGRLVGGFRRIRIQNTKAARLAAVLILSASYNHYSYGQDTIQVTGEFEVYHYNTVTGDVFTNETAQAAFSFTLSGEAWSIYATNMAASGKGLRTPWEGLIYDGTNTYTLMPNYTDGHGKSHPIRATILPGPFFLRDYDEFLDFEVIWLTYGLRPGKVQANNNGVVEIPLPWYDSRWHPFAYGAEWKIAPSEDGRFISQCQVLANTNLDLSIEEELRRLTFNYPENLGGRNHAVEVIGLRRDQFPHGFVQAVYKCTEWYRTNTFTIPMASEETRFVNQWRPGKLRLRGLVRASGVTVRSGLERLLPAEMAEETFVADYRFRRTNDTRFLPFIEYVIPASEKWKSDNDPALIREANVALKTATRFDYGNNWRKSFFTWLILGLFLLPVVLLIIKHKKHQNER